MAGKGVNTELPHTTTYAPASSRQPRCPRPMLQMLYKETCSTCCNVADNGSFPLYRHFFKRVPLPTVIDLVTSMVNSVINRYSFGDVDGQLLYNPL